MSTQILFYYIYNLLLLNLFYNKFILFYINLNFVI